MSCAAPLGASAAAREQRKVVTVLFCDLVGSTALGESTDPEALRARMRRYFEDLRVILERHGGSVEKFAGDAVMAVFGIPTAHEDDALRAVRAASEMREAIAEQELEARIGINTGEVVVGGEGETLVTGDAVNVAARFEQAATAGEILIGDETRLLVRDAVRLEPVEALTLKGKANPVEAFRLVEVIDDAAPVARHLGTPLVGRERERQRLWRDFEDAVADRTCRLFTLLGPAGIGKSRLVADFQERVGDSADILRGRCLSYGEGITYWPLVEILIAIGVDPESVIGSSPPETQLAFRRLLEGRAAARPQVVVIDDLQWAEPVFIDLVEHVADLSRGAPIFLLCIARTELLDVRPDWGGGKMNATSLLLEPLDAGQCAELMGLLATDGLDDELRARITAASAGNPLYVEEMLAMVREHGGEGEIVVPPTIHALLQARIDSLDGDVRVVMERGSVEGEVFHRGAVAELSPATVRDGVETHLATLVRKELIRSTDATFPEDEGFRFRHLLIRDAAYESLPKATRAELHERFAGWLAVHELVEGDEIVGYHLEQAHRYRSELDPADAALAGLAARASEHLSAAGRGALNRGDWNAGRVLLTRAADVLPTGDERRHELAPDIASALFEAGDFDAASDVLAEAQSAADPVARALVSVIESLMGSESGAMRDAAGRAALREEARPVLESAGHDHGLALYWWSVSQESWFRCRAEETAAACERALSHLAHKPDLTSLAETIETRLAISYYFGPQPIAIARERVEIIQGRTQGVLAPAMVGGVLGLLAAAEGDIDRGRELVTTGRLVSRDAGMLLTSASMGMGQATVEWCAGEPEQEERLLRTALEELEALGDRGYYPTTAVLLAECLYRRGADDASIEALCTRARETTSPDDIVNFVWLDLLEGLLHARRGEHADADEHLRDAVARAETTDFYPARSYAWAYLAEGQALGGNQSDAADSAARSSAVCRAKGDVMGAAQFRARLAEFDVEFP
jgi:class 3 adenylate cyclase/tetratricopeptide (TPR) repeat protein